MKLKVSFLCVLINYWRKQSRKYNNRIITECSCRLHYAREIQLINLSFKKKPTNSSSSCSVLLSGCFICTALGVRVSLLVTSSKGRYFRGSNLSYFRGGRCFQNSIVGNRIYNRILDRDWFSARDQVGVQLQVFDLNFFKSDTGNWLPT